MSCEDECGSSGWVPTFERGETWRRTFRMRIDDVLVDFTGWTGTFTIYRQDKTTVLHASTIGNGELTVNGDQGFTVVIPDDVTATFVRRSVWVRLAAISPAGETTYLVNRAGVIS